MLLLSSLSLALLELSTHTKAAPSASAGMGGCARSHDGSSLLAFRASWQEHGSMLAWPRTPPSRFLLSLCHYPQRP